jgi:hypothetical protein
MRRTLPARCVQMHEVLFSRSTRRPASLPWRMALASRPLRWLARILLVHEVLPIRMAAVPPRFPGSASCRHGCAEMSP